MPRRIWTNPASRFLVRYPMFTALLFLLPVFVPGTVPWLIHATLQSLGVAKLFMSSAVRVTEPTFSIGRTSIEIVPDCTAMFPTLLLFGGILAFPAQWLWKVIGVIAGAALLWLYNMVRIYVLMAVLRFAPAQFDIVHVYLWQTVTLLLVAGSFLLWIRLPEGRRRTP